MAQIQSEDNQAPLTRTGLVYDILNAGPQHRFTCEGVLVSNSIPYGAAAPLLERLIEAVTGRKPAKNTGGSIIEAWSTRYRVANEFLQDMEKIVNNPGYWTSMSGRVRHFQLGELSDFEDFVNREYTKLVSPLARQARNFPMQELVAATTAQAMLKFIEQRKAMGLQARIGILLYDAVTAFAPLSEVKVATELLKTCLTEIVWDPKTLNPPPKNVVPFHFEVDITHCFRWGMKPSKAEKARLAPYLA